MANLVLLFISVGAVIEQVQTPGVQPLSVIVIGMCIADALRRLFDA